MTPIPHLTPVDGWALYYTEEWSQDCAPWREYYALGPSPNIFEGRYPDPSPSLNAYQFYPLGLSRFRFTPTQERFAWLVRAGFPSQKQRPGGTWTPLDDDDIDEAIQKEKRDVEGIVCVAGGERPGRPAGQAGGVPGGCCAGGLPGDEAAMSRKLPPPEALAIAALMLIAGVSGWLALLKL